MPDSSFPLACCVEVPGAYVPKARYALRMLLMPLGLAPRWVARGALTPPALYYGTKPEGLPEGVVVLPMDPGAPAYFDRRVAYDPSRVAWVPFDGARWPVLFGEDEVASAFFWLSGWQEHAVRSRDPLGRFRHDDALQAALGTTPRPAVDAYRERLAGRLAAAGVPLRRRTWHGHAWALCPTHDVDYLRKWRPGMIYREAVEYLLLNRRRVAPGARLHRFGRFLADVLRPGDVYRRAFERMQAETEQRGGTATFFVKTGATSAHDVYYSPRSRYFRRRLASLAAAGFEVGLHPSFHSYRHPGYLQAERDRLAAVTAQPPVSVRQHYLRFEAPITPRLHHRTGFRIDATLGFAEHEGFRHATCHPFQLFDIPANAPLDLWEMPLSLMESALFNRRGMGVEEAVAATQALLGTCRRVGGVAVALWHNTLWDEMDCPGWGMHFLRTLDAAVEGGALVASLRDALDGYLGA